MVCIVVGVAVDGGRGVLAQQVPPGVSPGQLEKRFQTPRAPRARPELRVPEGKESRPPPNAEAIRFVLRGLTVEGSTVYKDADFLPLYQDKLNTEITVSDVYGIAAAVTAKYRNNGYILSRAIVPPQTIREGIVHLRVIEGHIDRFNIQGDSGDARDRIDRYGREIVGIRPLTAAGLERHLLLINDIPGIAANAILVPSSDATGASTLNLLVERVPFDASLSFDNRGSRFVGPYQTELNIGANALFGGTNRTRLRLIGATQLSELKFIEIGHEELVGEEGTKLTVEARRTVSDPGFTLKPLEVESRSNSADIKLSHPFIRTRPENVTGRAVFSLRDSKTEILGDEFSNDRVRALRLGATVDFVDRFRAINLIDMEISRGLNILDATETGSENLSRTLGKSDFLKIAVTASRLQQLVGPLSFLAAASGQYSNDPLLVSEEFALGGADFGSAYDSSEITGDSGAAARFELRYDGTLKDPNVRSLQPYMFYDLGVVWNKDPESGENPRESLSSVGLGLRAAFLDNVTASLEFAMPLTRAVAAAGDDGNDARFFFSLGAMF